MAHMPKAMNEAILNVMRDFGSLKKTSFNQHGRYNFAPIDDYYDRIQKLLPVHGLSITANEVESDLIPMVTQATDKNGNVTGSKTTIWIKTKWEFRLHHNGVTYPEEGIIRFAFVPTAGPQTEGIAQSYASKNFMREMFKIATGEYELDDMQPVEHGVPETETEKNQTNPVDIEKDGRETAKSYYRDIMSDKVDDALLKVLSSDVDTSAPMNKTQRELLQKVIHARRLIIGANTFDGIAAARDAVEAINADFRKDGLLAKYLTQREAEISATQVTK